MKSLNEMQKAVREAIASIRRAADEAIATMRAQVANVPPQKRERILKAAAWAGFAALVVGVAVYWHSRNQPNDSTEVQ